MKKYGSKFTSLLVLAWMVSYTANAQFDDIYFDPDTDDSYVDSYTAKEGSDTYVTEDYYYDDEDYTSFCNFFLYSFEHYLFTYLSLLQTPVLIIFCLFVSFSIDVI